MEIVKLVYENLYYVTLMVFFVHAAILLRLQFKVHKMYQRLKDLKRNIEIEVFNTHVKGFKKIAIGSWVNIVAIMVALSTLSTGEQKLDAIFSIFAIFAMVYTVAIANESYSWVKVAYEMSRTTQENGHGEDDDSGILA